jgi:hypothetical protein
MRSLSRNMEVFCVPGGLVGDSAHDRRKYRRMLKLLSEDLMAEITLIPSPIPKKPWWKASLGIIVTTATVTATLLAILGWPEIAEIYNPHFSVTLGPTLDSSGFLGTSVVVRTQATLMQGM